MAYIKKNLRKKFYVNIGEKYNKLTVVEDKGLNKRGRSIYLFKCECGTIKTLIGRDVAVGYVKSCGCLNLTSGSERRGKYTKYNVKIGEKYNSLNILSEPYYIKTNSKYEKRVCDCKCDCGTVKTFSVFEVVKNMVKSCGCLIKKDFIEKYNKCNVSIGEKYGMLIVEKFMGKNKKNKPQYFCKCECGGDKIVKEWDLIVGRVKSCGCLVQINGIKARGKNIKYNVKVGEKYNYLTILSMPDVKSEDYKRVCECICDCGANKTIKISELVTGSVKSCGCIHFAQDPWDSEIKFYYNRIKKRGQNLECNLTRDQFVDIFSSDCVYCGKKPEIKTKVGKNFYRNTIDRIDSSKGYIFENCTTSCLFCNNLKSNLSKYDFLNKVKNIYNYLVDKEYNFEINKQSFNNISVEKYEENILLSFKKYIKNNVIRIGRNGYLKIIEWHLYLKDYEDLIMNFCYYCGKKPEIQERNKFLRNGIDRVDNKVGYFVDNCVTCCWPCNKMKNCYLQKDFLQQIMDIHNYSITGNKIV